MANCPPTRCGENWIRAADQPNQGIGFRISGPGRKWAEGDVVGDSANVPRPAASSLISLRHPPQHPRQRAFVACSARTPTVLERSGRWGAKRRSYWGHQFRYATNGYGLRARIPTVLERSGWWGAQRSGIKEEAAGRGTAAELSAPPARSTRHTNRVLPVIP